MSVRFGLAVFSFSLSLTACGSSNSSDPTNPDPAAPDAGVIVVDPTDPTDPTPAVDSRFFVALADGREPADATFASESEVYLAAAGTRGAAGDYYFRVVADVLSTGGTERIVATADLDDCRRFHLGEAGAIDLVYPAQVDGAACEHAGIAIGGSGALVIATGPLADLGDAVTRDGVGRRIYHVQIAAYGSSFDGEGALDLAFYIAPPDAPPAVCGDGVIDIGEECDDGNVAYNDGCSGTCHVEHLCCCGDGNLEPGEACDDGNHVNGDGCSDACAIED
jgi:cysteine-rich repeat protein